MNCKPGDLAVIVGCCSAYGEFLIGRTVEVLSPSDLALVEGFAWNVRMLHPITNPLTGETGNEGTAADAFLRPIRDPGPDAVDEVLQRLGKPEATPKQPEVTA
jgi:hypothetical protein